MEQIAAACALEYMHFRRSPDWRKRRPGLVAGLTAFGQRPSMTATRPR